jgi:hypothetical protein
MRNALIVISLLGTAAVPPLVAQEAARSNTNIVLVSGDTTINITRGDKNSCTVEVGGGKLSMAEAERICDKKLATISFTSRGGDLMAVELERLRNTMKNREFFSKESLQKLSERELQLAEELKSRSLALTDRSTDMARLSRDYAEAMKSYKGNIASFMEDRTIIGVVVDAQPRDTDRHGAFVVSVTPNGPADKAGIHATDIIVKVDNKSITGPTARAADRGESPVWIRLSEVVGKLEPGKTATLEYRRDGKNHSTKVVPISDNRWVAMSPDSNRFAFRFGPGEDAPFFSVRPPEPGSAPEPGILRLREGVPLAGPENFPFGEMAIAPVVRGGIVSSFGRSFANIELAPVNPKLGAYFGTSTGVLVVDVPAKGNSMGLEAGDVITAVDGRAVDSPSALARILRSYSKDEPFTLKIMRNKQAQSVTSTLP